MQHPSPSRCRYHSEQPARWYCKPCQLHLCDTCKPFAAQLPDEVTCPLCGRGMQERSDPGDPLDSVRHAALNATTPPALALAASFAIVGALGFDSIRGLVLALPVGAILLYWMIILTRRAGEGHVTPPSVRQLIDIEQVEYGLKILPIGLPFASLLGVGALAPSAPLTVALIAVIAGSLPLVQLTAVVYESPRKALDVTSIASVFGAAKGTLALIALSFFLVTMVVAGTASLSGTIGAVLTALATFGAAVLALGASTYLGAIARKHRRILEYPAGVAPIDRPRPPDASTYEPAQFAAEADILQWEERLRDARQLLGNALTRYPDDRGLSARFDELVYQTSKDGDFRNHLERRVQRLVRDGQFAAATELWQRYSPRLDNWVPRLSESRYRLALELDELGDHQTAFRLLMTLPPDERKFQRIAEAWMEAARILDDRLNDPKRAAELRRQVRERFPERARAWMELWDRRYAYGAVQPSSAATATG